jgi:hypothetical protein
MKFYAIFVLLAAACLGTAGCAAKAAKTAAAPAVSAPRPRQDTSTIAADEPISIAQTNVVLPTPQPIQAGALSTPPPPDVTRPPEPSSPAAKPKVTAPRPEPRQQATVPPVPVPATTPPPANPPGSRRRIRPVESAAERNRLLNEVGSRQRQVQDILARVKTRPLSDTEKGTAERIQAFLDQTDAALKDQDLQQADALSNRALLLCQELNSGK